MRLTGHVRPLLPYAHALLSRGHEVVFAAPQSADTLLRDAGLAHAVFAHPGDERLGAIWALLPGMPAEEVLDTVIGRIFAEINGRAALPALRETVRTWKPDLILRESCEFAAAVAAAEAGIPVVRVATTNGHSEARVMRRATASVDLLRQETGLEPDQGAALRGAPVFTSFPSALDGDMTPPDVPAPFRVRVEKDMVDPGGRAPDWARDDGRPLMFITFGTLASEMEKSHFLFRAAIEAVPALPVRAVLSTGANMDRAVLGTGPDNVTVVSWVPQIEIFRRASALVCHGGGGTVLAGLTNGLPMVLTPFGSDMPDTARLVDATGAGIALFEPDAASLRAAMERALHDPVMLAAADRIADEISAMPSMDAAVDAFERLTST